MREGTEVIKEEYPNIEKYLENLVKQKKKLYNGLETIEKPQNEWRKIL